MIKFMLAILVPVAASVASAQEPTERRQVFTLGAYLGPHLPSNIPGVTEAMNVLGLRAALGEDVFKFELNGFRSSEKGASINYVLGALALHLQIPNVDFLRVVVMGGLQGAYIRRAPSPSGQEYSYARSSGVHLGGGFIVPYSPAWALRSQYTILNGPGRSVLFEVGLEYTFGGAAQEATNPE